MHKRYVKELPLANPQDVFTNGEIRYDELSKRSLLSSVPAHSRQVRAPMWCDMYAGVVGWHQIGRVGRHGL
jgi:hypothetical protein